MTVRRNDPFYCGTPADRRDAEWFAGLWQEFGFRPGTHLRRIHYVVSQSGGQASDGGPYLNSKGHWDQLMRASKAARYLGLIDPEAFTDRRTDAVQRHVFACGHPGPSVEITRSGGVYVPSLPEPPELDDSDGRAFFVRPAAEVSGYETDDSDQPALLELWVEKSTVNDVVEPLCAELGVNLKVGAGFESITAAVALLRRTERVGKPVHVFYMADLDRAGEGMPVQLSRQCEFWACKLGITVPVSVQRLVLTAGQVADYGLPQAPESGDTELDALEALHPGELARIIREAMAAWRDPGLDGRAEDAEAEAQRIVKAKLQAAAQDVAEDVAALAETTRAVHDRVREQLRPLVAQWREITDAAAAQLREAEEAAGDIEQRVQERVDDLRDVALPARPEARPPEVDRSRLLYDSQRPWLEQIAHYRAARRQAGGDR